MKRVWVERDGMIEAVDQESGDLCESVASGIGAENERIVAILNGFERDLARYQNEAKREDLSRARALRDRMERREAFVRCYAAAFIASGDEVDRELIERIVELADLSVRLSEKYWERDDVGWS